MEGSSGKAISGISSSFLMNFGGAATAGFFPGGPKSLRKVSVAEIGEEGGAVPPPGAAVAAEAI